MDHRAAVGMTLVTLNEAADVIRHIKRSSDWLPLMSGRIAESKTHFDFVLNTGVRYVLHCIEASAILKSVPMDRRVLNFLVDETLHDAEPSTVEWCRVLCMNQRPSENDLRALERLFQDLNTGVDSAEDLVKIYTQHLMGPSLSPTERDVFTRCLALCSAMVASPHPAKVLVRDLKRVYENSRPHEPRGGNAFPDISALSATPQKYREMLARVLSFSTTLPNELMDIGAVISMLQSRPEMDTSESDEGQK